ncbi:SUMF1/EgtB/PvdO family nonheme iron enzyme [Haliscomenobacter sp.]|uniref:SUMF1/EgtB/PvdO family nonheme iron enzyme n=1 Tax=Haliscomenobacter sp. TaxID=2717303 RepID=UPI003593CABE
MTQGQTAKGANRVLRGGSWNNNAQNCRSSNRNNNQPANRNNNVGFRVLLFPPPAHGLVG